MKRNLILSAIAVTAIATTSYAGGDLIIPDYIPVTEPVSAQAERVPVYVGVGLVRANYFTDAQKCEYEDVTYGAMLRAGYDFNEYIGVEARLMATFWEDDPQGGEKLQHIGIYAKPMLPVDEDANIYALLGYGWTNSSADGNRPEVDDSGFAAGVGLEYALANGQDDPEWGLFVDYQRLLIDSDMPDMDVISAGVTYDF